MAATNNPLYQKPASGRTLDTPVTSTVVSVAKEEHLSNEEQKYIANEVKTRPIKFEKFKVGETKSGGLVLAIIAAHKFGKSIWAGLLGYFNSKYKQYMPEGTRKLLSTGALPEITRVKIADTENTWKRDLAHGKMKQLLGPLAADGVIEIVPISLTRKKEGIDSGKIVNVNDIDIDNERQNFEAAVWDTDIDEGTLLILDSMSDYKGTLDDIQSIMFKKTLITSYKQEKGVAADAKSNEALRSQFNQYRNKWWHNTLIKARSYNSWEVVTIKLGETDDRFREEKDEKTGVVTMKPKFYKLWCPRTEYRIDNGYTMMDYINPQTVEMKTVLRLDWGKYEHKSAKPFDRSGEETEQEKSFIDYPQNDRMAGMKLLDDMSSSLLGEVSEAEEKALWGQA
jgi:hypothetical protein